MNFTTKYGVGDLVYNIERMHGATRVIPCDVCTDGTIQHAGQSWACPQCGGTKGKKESIILWVPLGPIQLSIVRVEYGANRRDDDDPDPMVSYMEHAHGSGTVYREDRLFASHAEAQAACENLNLGARARVEK